MTSKNFNELPTTQKGDFAEKIVDNFLREKGVMVYKPITEGAHWFDRVIARGKKELCVVEVKAKARMNKYPATGFNYNHYIQYMDLIKKHDMRVYVFFVDEMLGEIYYLDLKTVEEKTVDGVTYPKKIKFGTNEVIVFYQPDMKTIHKITEEEKEILKNKSNRNHDYRIVI